MLAELSVIIVWYIILLVIGWGSVPLAFILFRHFPDRGYAFAKPLGLLLMTYLIWLITSVQLTPYHRLTCLSVFAIYLLGNGWLAVLKRQSLREFFSRRWRLMVGEEGLFLAFFLAAVFIRMYTPDLTGAEKEADLTLLNAIFHSASFPPKDTWFSGASINYYYFGYAIWATIIKLSGVMTAVGFNLALASIVALAVSTSFGLTYRLTQRASYSLFAACLLMVFGNLDGLIQILQRGGELFPFNWWRSSRIIPDTINEFPYFSFLLGDLHAHFMSIPFVVLLLGLLRQLVSSLHPKSSISSLAGLSLCLGISLGGTAVMNNWDYPTALLISAGCLFLAFHNPLWKEVSIARRLFYSLLFFGLLAAFSHLLFLPFYLHFSPQVSIKNLKLVSALQRTELRYFLVIYGLFLWGLFPFLLQQLREWLPASFSRQAAIIGINVLLLSLALLYTAESERVFLISLALSSILFLNLYRDAPQSSNTAFIRGLLFMAFAIVAGCELFYIKDFYGHPLERQNTIFKFYYQAWILLAIGIPALLYEMSQHSKRLSRLVKVPWKIGLALLCGACCCYPLFATQEKTNHFQGAQQGGMPYIPTLNGIAYIAYRHPDEYAALMWIQNHLDQDVVILEATGRPYSFFGRVATTTGRSTVLGWGNHEALWRDQTWQSIMQRTQDIQAIYEALNKTLILDLLEQYQVEYVYVGALERENYNVYGLAAFSPPSFPLVYENDSVKIYATPFQH